MARFYHIVLMFVAPLAILGGEAAIRFVLRSKKEILTIFFILTILVPFFLFQTGFVYEVTKDESWSIPLSSYRFGWSQYSDQGLINGNDIAGTRWLQKNDFSGSVKVYADGLTRNSLLSGGYGMFPSEETRELASNATQIEGNSMVYLTWANTHYQYMYTGTFLWNTTEYVSSTLSDMNKIYENNGCQIYEKP
jgi:uncharacterized membrane protein